MPPPRKMYPVPAAPAPRVPVPAGHHTRSSIPGLLPDDLGRIVFVARPAPAYWKSEWYMAKACWPPETEACAGAQSSCPYDALWRAARYVLARLGVAPSPGEPMASTPTPQSRLLFAPNP